MRNAASEILNFQMDYVVIRTQTDQRSLAAGMPVNITKTFLDNTEQGGFDLGRKSGRDRITLQLNQYAASLIKFFDILAECRQ